MAGLQQRSTSSNQHTTQPSSNPDAEAMQYIQQLTANPYELSRLSQMSPALATAVRNNDVATVRRMLAQWKAAQQQQQQELARLQADPLNPDNQRRIEAMLRQQQVNENYENAMEHNPVGFARVIMLYIPVSVNGVPLKAFVDSGAQSTIMSERVARQCNLGHLIDTRFHGIAKGVGACKIVGRVHLAPLKIGDNHYNCTFTIIENNNMEFLLGLDMLKAHQACIDLKNNLLRMGDGNTLFLKKK